MQILYYNCRKFIFWESTDIKIIKIASRPCRQILLSREANKKREALYFKSLSSVSSYLTIRLSLTFLPVRITLLWKCIPVNL
jgi:hypothetical protein